jgi:hypothetical protein
MRKASQLEKYPGLPRVPTVKATLGNPGPTPFAHPQKRWFRWGTLAVGGAMLAALVLANGQGFFDVATLNSNDAPIPVLIKPETPAGASRVNDGFAAVRPNANQAPAQQSQITQNGANAYLLSLSSDARAQMLGKAIAKGCSAQIIFYMGIGTAGLAKDQAFWSVRCQDGRTYAVEVHPNGTSTLLECSALKTVHAGECFKKLAD